MAKDIRVRYAPSPTGLLHIGNARTALFNYLYARHHGGTFIIRIEDTDRKRHVEDGERSQLDNLRWLGIDWDESPETHENYRQSERLPLYQKYIDQLLAEGKAYKSYVTEEELAAERERQEAAGETPRYINEFLGMTEEEKAAYIAEREAAGIVPTVRLAVNESGIYKWHDIVKGDIEFENVVFQYDNNPKPTIQNFSAKAKAGQKIAIVGPTGAGKTTLVNLLMKFYDINSGDIKIDGVSTKELTRENIHDLFTMVLQDTWLFDGTIKENIVYNTENVTDEQVKEVCKVVGLDHFIKTLPKGLDTELSDNDEISAGQKQLLTIARGMLNKTPFLILDEATSNVDTRTEELVQKAMDKLTEGKTSFIIAHRLSTIKNADLILVVDNGNIIEQGNHEELMEKHGFYADLYNSQFEL